MAAGVFWLLRVGIVGLGFLRTIVHTNTTLPQLIFTEYLALDDVLLATV